MKTISSPSAQCDPNDNTFPQEDNLMRFEIELTREAIDDMRSLKKNEQTHIIQGIEIHLAYQAGEESSNRKKLRPNQLAEWELRIDRFRVFYDIDTDRKHVRIEAVGYKKGNTLIIRREEFEL